MPTKLIMPAVEKSTIVITASFHDEAGSPMIPSTISWSLLDDQGEIVNNREDVVVEPSTSIDIVLSGDDLDIKKNEIAESRICVISGRYNSSYGTDLHYYDSVFFQIISASRY